MKKQKTTKTRGAVTALLVLAALAAAATPATAETLRSTGFIGVSIVCDDEGALGLASNPGSCGIFLPHDECIAIDEPDACQQPPEGEDPDDP